MVLSTSQPNIGHEIESLHQYIEVLEQIAHENKYAGSAYGAADVLSDVDELPFRDEIEGLFEQYEDGDYSGEELERELFALYDDEFRNHLAYVDGGEGPGPDDPGGPDEPDEPGEPEGTEDPDDPDDPDDPEGPGDGPHRTGYDFDLDIVLDEPEEYRWNAIGWPLSRWSKRQMKEKGYAPVPRYDVAVTGADAERVVEEYIGGFEVEALIGDDREQRKEQIKLDEGNVYRPADNEDIGYDEDENVLLWRAPDHLEDLVSDKSWLRGRSWPDHYSLRVKAVDGEGEYVGR